MVGRNDKSLPNDDFSDPTAYWSSVRKAMREKSDHNKFESQSLFFIAILCSILVPLFIAYGSDDLYSKIVPSCLSATVTAITAWLQLRQPQRLWSIYRRAQRELEDVKVRFDNRIGEFSDEARNKQLLAERVADIALKVHDQWEKLVPEPSTIRELVNKKD